jgi:hypothetical protein
MDQKPSYSPNDKRWFTVLFPALQVHSLFPHLSYFTDDADDERLSSFSHSSVVLEDSQLSSLMMLMMLQLLVMTMTMMTEVKQNKRFEAPGKP